MKPLHKHITAVEGNKTGGNQLFPVFIKLNQLHTVLIGAGNVGLEKLTAVLNNSPQAKITVIASEVVPEVEALSSTYDITVNKKLFDESDLDDADIVVAATNNPELNKYIKQAAHNRKLLVNVADKPDLCDFYLGSIVQKGDLKIAISTNGKSPTVAKRIKEFLNEEIPAEIDTTLQQINGVRNSLKGNFAYKVKTLNEVTAVLSTDKKPVSMWYYTQWLALLVILAVVGIMVLASWQDEPEFKVLIQNISPIFYCFVGTGILLSIGVGVIIGSALKSTDAAKSLIKTYTRVIVVAVSLIAIVSIKSISDFLFSVFNLK